MIDLPPDIERCPGIGSEEEGWFEDCETCLRRLAKPSEATMKPPEIIVFFCEYYIPVDNQGQQIRLRTAVTTENSYRTETNLPPSPP